MITAKEVIGIARSRGFEVKMRPGPPAMPFLLKPADVDKSQATEALLEALHVWRVEIMELIRRREWLWPRGQTFVETDPMPVEWRPVGAFWWRWEGEPDWLKVGGEVNIPEPHKERLTQTKARE